MKKIIIVCLAILWVGIVNAQKVGVNTTSPDSSLTVIGSTRITGNTLIGGNLKLPTGAGTGKWLRSDAGGNATWSVETGLPAGTAAGQMLYWNGTAWVNVAPGPDNKKLALCNGVPTWDGCPVTITTALVTDVLTNTAICGGNITDSGGYQIIARGVCYSSIFVDPTIANSKTNDGSGAGSFTSYITSGLAGNIQYYLRSYATNSAGKTFYGDRKTFTTYPPILSQYGGGTLFYFLRPGDIGYSPNVTHGLVVSNFNGPDKQWGTIGVVTSATDTLVGTGALNTTKIYQAYGNSPSCAGCQAYVMFRDGYSDWFLPSKDELAKLFPFRQAIAGFNAVNYWSSTEDDASSAWAQNFGTGPGSGGQFIFTKSAAANYRPIRRF